MAFPPENTVFVIGDVDFGPSVFKGHPSTPVKKFVKLLGAIYPVVLIYEALTSQSCSLCGCQLGKACHSWKQLFSPVKRLLPNFGTVGRSFMGPQNAPAATKCGAGILIRPKISWNC